MSIIENSPAQSEKIVISAPVDPVVIPNRHSRGRLAFAFAVAGVSDILAFWATIAPPVQWALDGVTALALFLILGRRWALLPGLIAEAIPGTGIFPVWILVVASIAIYDGIKKPHKTIGQ